MEFDAVKTVSKQTRLPNEIGEKYGGDFQTDNTQHQSTISPSKNIIDDDYQSKHQSRESDDLVSDYKVDLNDPSESRKNPNTKMVKSYNLASRESLSNKRRISHSYNSKSAQHGTYDYNVSEPENTRITTNKTQEHNSEEIHKIELKNNSDNEVGDDTEFGYGKNLSYVINLDNQTYDANVVSYINPPNKTQMNNHATEYEKKETSFSNGKHIYTQKHIERKSNVNYLSI